MIEAALRGLERLVDDNQFTKESQIAELAQCVLEYGGHAIRAQLPFSRRLRNWMAALPARIVDAVADLACEELSYATWPVSRSNDQDNFYLQRRDAAESLRVAIVWWCISRDLAPVDSDGHTRLSKALTTR
jgi:hypothetical protein